MRARLMWMLLLSFSLAGIACKKKPAITEDAGGPAGGAALRPPPPASAGAGTIQGSVAFTGTPPTPAPVQRTPDCGGLAPDEAVLVNANKTLKNVVVRLTRGAEWDYPPAQTPLQV